MFRLLSMHTPKKTSPKRFRFLVPGNGSVSAILSVPSNSKAILVLAHGAGAGMDHSAMQALSEALNAKGIATLRYQFLYMEKGSKRPDRPKLAVAVIESAIRVAAQKVTKLPLYAGGKSFGGRMTTTAASMGLLKGVEGIVCFSFPLHPPKKPGIERAEHLAEVDLPMLWIQGTRDDLAQLALMKKVVKAHKNIQLHLIDGADHSYGVLKASCRTNGDVLGEVGQATAKFCKSAGLPR